MTEETTKPTSKKPAKKFLKQPMMINVLVGLAPCVLGAAYFFGLRSLVMLAVCGAVGLVCEGAFTLRQGKPVTSSVLVSVFIYTLSLPPTTPFYVAIIGMAFGVVFGKMVFGGFGHNPFNPAMVGRCFVYLAFPIALTNQWVEPFSGFPGGFARWSPPFPPDAVSTATPLDIFKSGGDFPMERLFIGNVAGSYGETAAWLILIGGLYIMYKKSANYRLALSCLLGGAAMSSALWAAGVPNFPDPLSALLAGSFLFGAFFVITEPVSGPKQKAAMWIYGFLIGALVMIIRRYSGWSAGIMWATLIMNVFASLMDIGVKEFKGRKKAKAAA